MERSRKLRRGAPERALAWVYTGPLGHLYGVLADVGGMWARYMFSRARARASRRLRQQ